MAYYLTVKEKQSYKFLDVTTTEEFTRISKFKNGSYSLEEIDCFTSKFASETELKKKLYEKGILTFDELQSKIEIRMKLNDKLEKVRYDLIYQNNKKYLDIQYLTSQLLILSNDSEFINKLLDRYRNSYKQEGLRQINAIVNGYRDSDLNMSKAIYQFIQDEIFQTDRKTGLVTIKYKSLHDLAMFIYNYTLSKEPRNKENKIEELNKLKQELIEGSKPKDIITVKKKIKKPQTELEGQISFF